MLIDVRPDHLDIVRRILRQYVPQAHVWAFGSRAKWNARDISDLDLCIDNGARLSFERMGLLEEAFANSTLPYKVDVVDMHSVSDSFRQIIERDKVALSVEEKQMGGVPEGWREVALSGAVSINPKVTITKSARVPFVDMKQLEPGRREVFSDEMREFNGSGSRFEPGDTLMARITPCLENGKIAKYHSDKNKPANGSTEFIVFRGTSGISDTDFAYYLVTSPHVRQFAIAKMTGTSGRQRVPVDSFDKLLVALPPLPEQKAIAAILGALDDKIEANRRMNATLEGIARAQFKSWFVDFDPVHAKAEGRPSGLPADLDALFPTSFTDSPQGEIPTGWQVGTLADIAQNPRDIIQPESVSPETPYIGLEHMPKRSISLYEWGAADDITSHKTKFAKGDFLFGKLRPYFHKVGIAAVDGIASTDIAVVRPKKEDFYAFALSIISSDEFIDYTHQLSNGARMPRINWPDMAKYEFVLPSSEIASYYNSAVKPFCYKIISIIHENQTLATLRDTLLPKLISGQIRVKDAEKRVVGAA